MQDRQHVTSHQQRTFTQSQPGLTCTLVPSMRVGRRAVPRTNFPTSRYTLHRLTVLRIYSDIFPINTFTLSGNVRAFIRHSLLQSSTSFRRCLGSCIRITTCHRVKRVIVTNGVTTNHSPSSTNFIGKLTRLSTLYITLRSTERVHRKRGHVYVHVVGLISRVRTRPLRPISSEHKRNISHKRTSGQKNATHPHAVPRISQCGQLISSKAYFNVRTVIVNLCTTSGTTSLQSTTIACYCSLLDTLAIYTIGTIPVDRCTKRITLDHTFPRVITTISLTLALAPSSLNMSKTCVSVTTVRRRALCSQLCVD